MYHYYITLHHIFHTLFKTQFVSNHQVTQRLPGRAQWHISLELGEFGPKTPSWDPVNYYIYIYMIMYVYNNHVYIYIYISRISRLQSITYV